MLEINREDLNININESNSNTLHLVDLYKFPSSFQIQVQIKSDMTTFCMENGNIVQNHRISPHILATDEFYNVDFSINEQRAKSCPKPQSYKACSECSSTDHIYQELTSLSKKYINYFSNHSTYGIPTLNQLEPLRNNPM